MNNVKNLSSILILSTSLIVVGCDEKVQTVEWYKNHETERQKMIEKCNSEFKDTPNCTNAKEAAINARWDKTQKTFRKSIS